MFTLIRLRNPLNTTQALTINELVASPIYPVEKFSWDYQMDGDEIPKFEAPGQFDNLKVVRTMTLDCEGHIVTQTTAAYWTARKNLSNMVVPPPTIPTIKKHVRIEMQLDGDSATYYGDFVLDDYSIPLEANYPTVTPFLFQWTCNFGYWRNIATNAAVRL
jgi:hypothetical protein